MEIVSPTKIDHFCSSNSASPLCPYSAPEVLFRGKVLTECDFYSLGVIMYEMMTQ
jgi:serine/threonine protein kinase